MCFKLVECYAVCKCIYHSHSVDACPAYGRNGHDVKIKEVLVSYSCAIHGSNLPKVSDSTSAINRSVAYASESASHAVRQGQIFTSQISQISKLRWKLRSKYRGRDELREKFNQYNEHVQILASLYTDVLHIVNMLSAASTCDAGDSSGPKIRLTLDVEAGLEASLLAARAALFKISVSGDPRLLADLTIQTGER